MIVVEERAAMDTGLASVLAALVSSFSASPHLNGKKMRDLLHLDPEAFRNAAIAALREPAEDPRGYRYVVTLLSTHGLLIPLLTDASVPIAFASTLACSATKIDPQLHLRLIRILADSTIESHDLPEAAVSRLLELLGLIADPTTLQPFLRQMLFHPSARVRSKVGRLIGRLPGGARSLETLLSDADERVRANAAEALWDHEKEHALALLPGLLDDSNHRVVGNAIVGLYKFGDLRCIPAIARLNDHPEPLFRAAGIWVMGRSQDPRYLPQLGRMLAESSGSGRKSLFNAVNSIKKAAAIRALNPPLKVTALRVSLTENGTTIQLAVQDKRPFDTPSIQPTGFWLTADQRPVQLIDCAEKRSDSVALDIVLPCRSLGDERLHESLEAAIFKALEHKPVKELWSIAHYGASAKQSPLSGHLFGVNISADPKAQPSAPAVPSSTANPDLLRSVLTKPATACSGWAETTATAVGKQVSGRASRHLITFAESTSGIDQASIDRILALAQENRVSVHVLSRHADERLSNLCAQTSGHFRLLRSDGEIEDQLVLLFAVIKAHYSVTFACHPPTDGLPQRIGIQAYNASHSGEGEWRNEPPL